jgi:hypothetical protein
MSLNEMLSRLEIVASFFNSEKSKIGFPARADYLEERNAKDEDLRGGERKNEVEIEVKRRGEDKRRGRGGERMREEEEEGRG